MMVVKRYRKNDEEAWNEFVTHSKQGTFMFNRSYMDYHSDRFNDHSLLVYRKDRLFALLPANEDDGVLWSHQGLTYGGLLTTKHATVAEVCDTFRTINDYLQQVGISKVVYKAVPWIYHRLPAEEDLYALTNVCAAQLMTRHVSSAILLDHRLPFTESRKGGIRKAKRAGIRVGESDDLAAFWTILDNNLEQKYSAHPVHSLAELQLLKQRFPDKIRLFMACDADGRALGGTLIYEANPQVVHTQYISASPEGKAHGALDLLFDYILNKVYADRQGFFDFGKSSDGDGHDLNTSLIFQKEGFGGRAVCYDWYEYSLMY